MVTSRDRYYMEMYKAINYYNNRNNTPLLSENIQEEMCKVMEEESIRDAYTVTADTCIHAYSAQRENSNMVFTSEKL